MGRPAERRLSSGLVCDLFTKGTHHRNISIIPISQNIFHQSKHCSDISLNAKYLVLLKNVRDRSQFSPVKRRESLPTAAAEIDPKKPNFEIDDEVEVSNYGENSRPNLKRFQHNARFLYKQYGIRRKDDGRVIIGDSKLTVDDTSDISINWRHFKGTRGLWEL